MSVLLSLAVGFVAGGLFVFAVLASAVGRPPW